jgi:hypothetical protein
LGGGGKGVMCVRWGGWGKGARLVGWCACVEGWAEGCAVARCVRLGVGVEVVSMWEACAGMYVRMCGGGRGGERALSGEYVGGVCRYVVCMCIGRLMCVGGYVCA